MDERLWRFANQMPDAIIVAVKNPDKYTDPSERQGHGPISLITITTLLLYE
jgi:hypothetical protein